MYRTTSATNYYDLSVHANSLAHVELFCKELIDNRIFIKQNSRYEARAQGSATFHIAPNLYALGAKAIGTGEPVRKYKDRARLVSLYILLHAAHGSRSDRKSNCGDGA